MGLLILLPLLFWEFHALFLFQFSEGLGCGSGGARRQRVSETLTQHISCPPGVHQRAEQSSQVSNPRFMGEWLCGLG